MSKHTPAPWHFHLSENDGVNRTACIHAEYEIPGGKRHHAVCTVEDLYYRGEHQVDALANARLIAAAPELLGVLEGILKIQSLWLPAEVDPEYAHEAEALHSMREMIIAAIAKATGEQATA